MRRIKPIEIKWDDEPYEVMPDWFKDDDMLSFEDVLHALGCVDCECGHYDPPPLLVREEGC